MPDLILDAIPPAVDCFLRDPDAALVINTSGSKDSLAMAYWCRELRRQRAYRARLIAVHADLGMAEWPGSTDIVAAQMRDLDIPLFVVRRRNGGLVRRFWQRWETVRDRTSSSGQPVPPWSSSASRFCTSDLKRGPIDRFLRSLDSSRIICALGLRGEESPARARKPALTLRKQVCTGSFRNLDVIPDALEGSGRLVLDWLPIHSRPLPWVWNWCSTSEGDVARRRALMASGALEDALRGWPLPYPYLLGSSRFSCALCVLASKGDIAIGAAHHPRLLANYRALEHASGSSFRQDLSLSALDPSPAIAPAPTLARLNLALRSYTS